MSKSDADLAHTTILPSPLYFLSLYIPLSKEDSKDLDKVRVSQAKDLEPKCLLEKGSYIFLCHRHGINLYFVNSFYLSKSKDVNRKYVKYIENKKGRERIS